MLPNARKDIESPKMERDERWDPIFEGKELREPLQTQPPTPRQLTRKRTRRRRRMRRRTSKEMEKNSAEDSASQIRTSDVVDVCSGGVGERWRLLFFPVRRRRPIPTPRTSGEEYYRP
jgi:hypothetical protein